MPEFHWGEEKWIWNLEQYIVLTKLSRIDPLENVVEKGIDVAQPI